MRTIYIYFVLMMSLVTGCGDTVHAVEPVKIVRVLEVNPAPITQEVYRAARLEGVEEALIIPAVGGRIEEVLVLEGDTVEAGEPLVRLVTDHQVSAGTTAAIAGINAARANAENTQRNYERLQTLYDAGAVSEAQIEDAKTARESANAQLVQAQAGYRQALSTADNSYINSPFAGTVGRVWAREGNMAGGSPLLSISNSTSIVAEILLPEEHIRDLHVGLPARVELINENRDNYPGIVTAAARAVDPISGMVAVEVAFANNEGLLFPGQSGRVAIGISTSENALSVPAVCLIGSTSGYQLALEKDGVVSIINVETGIRNMGYVEITSGLSQGDNVIFSGQQLVADGEYVEVKE